MSEDAFPAGLRFGVTLLLAAFLLAGAFTRQPHAAVASIVGSAVALAAAYVAMHPGARLAPVWLLIAGAGAVLNAGGGHGSIGWFAICVLALIAIPVTGFRVGSAIAMVLTGLVVYKLLDDGFHSGWLPWVPGVIVSALGGAMIAHERCLVLELRAAQADLAERSRVEERTRIARDLHDVIAHSLTVSLLHVTAARLAVEHDPDDAARALLEAERLGRESLDEVRSIVGLMRDTSESGVAEPQFAPTPGLERLPELIERFRNAGVAISFERSGRDDAVPGTVGTTAYRIAQEALTNAVKHAPGAAVAVRVCVAEKQLDLTVDSSGAPGTGQGSGLASMHERAEAVGGRLVAGAALDAGQGWRVSAQLPLGGGRWLS